MTATTFDLSAIVTNLLNAQSAFRQLIDVYSKSETDELRPSLRVATTNRFDADHTGWKIADIIKQAIPAVANQIRINLVSPPFDGTSASQATATVIVDFIAPDDQSGVDLHLVDCQGASNESITTGTLDPAIYATTDSIAIAIADAVNAQCSFATATTSGSQVNILWNNAGPNVDIFFASGLDYSATTSHTDGAYEYEGTHGSGDVGLYETVGAGPEYAASLPSRIYGTNSATALADELATAIQNSGINVGVTAVVDEASVIVTWPPGAIYNGGSEVSGVAYFNGAFIESVQSVIVGTNAIAPSYYLVIDADQLTGSAGYLKIDQVEYQSLIDSVAAEAADAAVAASNAQSTANAASTAASAAQTSADSAAQVAASAVDTANSASTAASAAQSTANDASTAASAAQSTANSASTAASAAQTSADSAAQVAASAVDTANSASTAASAAQSTANDASTAASAAQSTANSASTAASAAQTSADSAAQVAASAVDTANSASTAASAAQSTANDASTAASAAQSTANSASTAASAAQSAVASKGKINYQEFTSNGTWTAPTNAVRVTVTCISGGAGGGSGRRGASGTDRSGGGGGAGGNITLTTLMGTDNIPTGDVPVTVGQGGTGGAGVTTDNTNGNNGGTGGQSIFGTASSGSGSSAWAQANSVIAGQGGGTTTGVAGAANGIPCSGVYPFVNQFNLAGGAGSSGNAPNQVSNATAQPIGGSGGAGISAANVNGSRPGGESTFALSGFLSAAYKAGRGGRGGSATQAATNGVNYGGGGGGGGASVNGTTSGAGGNGAPGIVIVVAECSA